MSEYRLEVGTVVLALELPRRQRRFLESYFRRDSSARTAHVHLEIRLSRDGWERSIPESLYHSKRLTQEGFRIEGDLIRGEFSAVTGQGWLRIPRFLLGGRLTRVFEQLLYQAFYSACRRCAYDACLLHAAAVARQGAGWVFVGPSGAGKSTVASLSPPGSVLNDEISLLELEGEQVLLRDTPFNGFFDAKVQGCVPLRGVFLIEHGPEHRVGELSLPEAAKRLLAQLAPPVGLEETMGGASVGRMLEITDRLLARVPVRRLRFRPDPGFWDEIDRVCARGER